MRALRESVGLSRNMRFEVDVAPDVETATQYLTDDVIDIYLVDLRLQDPKNPGYENAEIGRALVQRIVQESNAGLIIHSSLPAETDAEPLLLLGADDYIEKPIQPELFRAKVVALWRRVQQTRPKFSSSFTHANRTFLIGGKWRFSVGNRQLTTDGGESIKITPTEHAFLRYICTVEDHEISRETFNVEVLGRPLAEKDRRMDAFIYRLRNKLGECVEIISRWDGNYKLVEVQESGKSPK
jgi:DNA-binding response OmpR family regulator